jgi:predicted nucleic acid-binding protein
MATLLLDTSVMIDAINGKRDRRLFLRGLVEQGDLLACCAINVAEVYAGMRPKEEERTSAFLASLDYLPITFPVARLAGELKRDFSKKGATLSLTDSVIAAVAIQYRVALITDNVKDFPMRDLDLFRLPEQR